MAISIKETIEAMNTRKLHSALIELGNDVKTIEETPSLADIKAEQDNLNRAIEEDKPKAIRKHGLRLAALTTKFMIDKL